MAEPKNEQRKHQKTYYHSTAHRKHRKHPRLRERGIERRTKTTNGERPERNLKPVTNTEIHQAASNQGTHHARAKHPTPPNGSKRTHKTELKARQKKQIKQYARPEHAKYKRTTKKRRPPTLSNIPTVPNNPQPNSNPNRPTLL